MKSYDYFESPLGTVEVCCEEEFVIGVNFVEEKKESRSTRLSKKAIKQLKEYFEGKRTTFDLPLRAQGTPFQEKVWQALQTIPYGETRSYGAIAAQVDSPKAARAVGLANNRNPISLIIPCHRVIGASGALVGYGGGLDKKEWLLEMEKKKSLYLR